MTFNQRSNGRDQLRQRSTQRDKGQGDDTFGHAQRLGDQCTIINEQICANGDDRRTGDQQDQRLGQGDQLFLFGEFTRPMGFIMLAMFVAYMVANVRQMKNAPAEEHAEEEELITGVFSVLGSTLPGRTAIVMAAISAELQMTEPMALP